MIMTTLACSYRKVYKTALCVFAFSPLFGLLFALGCSGWSDGITQLDAFRAELSYKNMVCRYTQGTPITENMPKYAKAVTLWSVEPALPNGLVIDPVSGIISGTPAAVQDALSYTVTAHYNGGTASVQVSIAVDSGAPSGLQYAVPTCIYSQGYAISANYPVYSGSSALWSVSPVLPSGLTFDTSSGMITGTPSALQSAIMYTVSAVNIYGSASTVISIEVVVTAPSPSATASSSSSATASASSSFSGVYDIDWETDADEAPFVSGAIGTQYTVRLPAGGSATSTIWGEDIYSDDSSIGKSAVHAGLITYASGGTVTIEIQPGLSSYIGSTRNGVTSNVWASWPRSFIFK